MVMIPVTPPGKYFSKRRKSSVKLFDLTHQIKIVTISLYEINPFPRVPLSADLCALCFVSLLQPQDTHSEGQSEL